MSPITHFLAGWVVANSANVAARDRALVTIAGVAPDIDALGLIAELASRNSENPLNWWSNYHHVLCHNLGFGLIMPLIGGALGLLGGIGIGQLLTLMIPALPVHTPWTYVLLVEVSAVLIGLVAGVFPALRAARLDPVEALRAE